MNAKTNYFNIKYEKDGNIYATTISAGIIDDIELVKKFLKKKVKLISIGLKVILLLLLFTSCKTKTILVENVRNTRDSTENVELKQRVTVSEKALYEARMELKINEQKASELIERLNVSETEKQQLRETFETIVKEYNEQGVLIKESYSKRTSELIKDISKLEEQNKNLTSTNSTQTELITYYTTEIARMADMNVEMNKKMQLLEKENSELKLTKTVKSKFQWWLILIGFAGGLLFYYYFGRIVSWIVKKLSMKNS